jgi:hypothetical protein
MGDGRRGCALICAARLLMMRSSCLAIKLDGIGRTSEREGIVMLRKRWAETRDAFRDEIRMTAFSYLE